MTLNLNVYIHNTTHIIRKPVVSTVDKSLITVIQHYQGTQRVIQKVRVMTLTNIVYTLVPPPPLENTRALSHADTVNQHHVCVHV